MDQQWMGAVLKAAILTDEAQGFLPVDQAEWLSMAAQELMDGLLGPTTTLQAAADQVAQRAGECMIGAAPAPAQLLRHLPEASTQDLLRRLVVYDRLQSHYLPAYHALYPCLKGLGEISETWGPEGWFGAFLEQLSDISGIPLTQSTQVSAPWAQALGLNLTEILGKIPEEISLD